MVCNLNYAMTISRLTKNFTRYICLGVLLFSGQLAYGQLTIFPDLNQAGISGTCVQNTIYVGASIPQSLNNLISSIQLQQGFMATLAENEDGTGSAYTFVAATSTVTVNLTSLLNDKVSFIRVLPLRNTKKKGVGNTNNAWIDPLNVSWFYDWGASDVGTVNREYALMAWGRSGANSTNVNNYIAKPDITHLLSFNEPDNVDQSNIPFGEAVTLHKNLTATGYRLGSPAPTEGQATVWLTNFMDSANRANVKVDFMAVHWYDWGSYLSTLNTAPDPNGVFTRFKNYINNIYAIYNKPIWITEFNANRNTTSATHEAFIALAVPWLESQPFVERYAYFFPPALPPVDGGGNLTAIGTAYKNQVSNQLALGRNWDQSEIGGIPVSDELILPQYAYYGGVSNAHRVPFACRLKLTGLTPNGNYRYMTGLSSNPNLTFGAGNQAPGQMYRINNTSNTYGFITGFTVNKAIGGSGPLQNDMMYTAFTNSYYGSFTADASGNYTGWFSAVPTGGTGQAKNSNAYFYVQTSAAGGTSFTTSYRTTSTITLLDYTNDATGCTPLLGTSDVGGEKMVTIYNNTASAGRPLYCTFTESNNNPGATPAGALTEGSLWNNPAIYPVVDGVSGSWAAIVPNSLIDGVKAINFLNIADASVITLSNAPRPNTSEDGRWYGVNTANPAGDSTAPIRINSIAVPVFYPITSNTDLSLISNWTSDINGGAGTAPANFTSANQVFNVNQGGTVLNALTISGGSYFTVSTTSGLVFGPSSSFTIGASSTADLANRSVTFKSTAAGTARLAAIAGSLTGAGNVTIERYIPAGGRRAWRLLGATVSPTGAPTINASWQEGGAATATGTHITQAGGSGTNGFDGVTSTVGGSSILYWNGTSLLAPTNTNVTRITDNGGAYYLFVRGDRTLNINTAGVSSNTTLRQTGALRQGNITTGVMGASFSLIPNPYASPVDYESIFASNAFGTYYLWDANIAGAGGYRTIQRTGPGVYTSTPTTGSDNTMRYIRGGQAFFIPANSQVNFTEAMKTALLPAINVYRTGVGTEEMSIDLRVMDGSANGILYDGVRAQYNNNYSVGVTAGDAPKLNNFSENLAIARDNINLSVEQRPLIDAADTIFLKLWNTGIKNYRLDINPSNFSTSANLEAFLLDSYLNTTTAVSLSANTLYNFSITANAASAADNRFMIVYRSSTTLPVNYTGIKAYQKNTGIQIEWNVAAEVDVVKYEVEKSINGTSFERTGTVIANNSKSYNWYDPTPNNGNNFYRIKGINKNNSYQFSHVVNVKLGNSKGNIAVYPNSIKGSVINLQFTNQEKGTYNVQLINSIGQQVYRGRIVHQGGSSSTALQLNAMLGKGIYELVVYNDHKKITQKVMAE